MWIFIAGIIIFLVGALIIAIDGWDTRDFLKVIWSFALIIFLFQFLTASWDRHHPDNTCPSGYERVSSIETNDSTLFFNSPICYIEKVK